MRRGKQVITFLLLGFAWAAAQKAPAFFVQSFRQGPTQITEDKFEAKLDPQNANYKERIQDERGNDRYVLTIDPLRPQGDTEITSWEVKLQDLHHPIYRTILTATPNGSGDVKDTLAWLNPSRFSPIPPKAERIIKVDNFYVVLQVKAYHFTPPDSPYLDSMTVDVDVTNTNPRGPAQ